MNREDFLGWQANYVTEEIFEKLEELKQSLITDLSSGHTLATTADETAMLTARIVGKIEGLNQVLGLDYIEEAITTKEEDV